jgi:hypothetical protein
VSDFYQWKVNKSYDYTEGCSLAKSQVIHAECDNLQLALALHPSSRGTIEELSSPPKKIANLQEESSLT